MKRFALGIGAGIVAVFGGLATAYGALSVVWPSSLPAPAISRLVPMDEKLRFLRRHPEFDPGILAVGSSITWRQLDGGAFEVMTDQAGGGFLNGGTGFLKIHQTRDLLDFYLARYAQVDTVLILTGPPDFEDCSKQPARMLDHADARAYAFGGWPAAYFYLRYFSPQRYLRSVMTLAGRRAPFVGDLFLDAYGSGPLDVPASMKQGLRYEALTPDPACADALVALSRDLSDRGLRLVVVFAPVHPGYRERYPEVADWITAFARKVAAQTAGHGTKVIRMSADRDYAPEDFFDAFHLQWPAVQRLSARIAESMPSPEQDVSGGVEMSMSRLTRHDSAVAQGPDRTGDTITRAVPSAVLNSSGDSRRIASQ